MENPKTPTSSESTAKRGVTEKSKISWQQREKKSLIRGSVQVYAIQCGKCFKWRIIQTQEEYEDIRSKIIDEPFFCDRKRDVSCEDAADIEYDATRTWAVDKPDIPKTPVGFKRTLILRKDYSKLDAYYVTPDGKKLRSRSEVEAHLERNPICNVDSLDFNFSVPKIMEDTIPENVERKGSASRSKRIKMSKEDNVQESLED